MLGQALMEENNENEYRKMRRIYGINDERTQMANIKIPASKRLHPEIEGRWKKEREVQPYIEVNEETEAKRHECQDFKWQWNNCER